jgi:cytoskeletal protein CcmA (bactofilin family)
VEDAPTVIGAGARFEGLLSYRGKARLDGELDGEVAAEGALWIGRSARVRARVRAHELVVEGDLEGDVEVSGRVEVRATGRLVGALAAPRLAVADGARLGGRVAIGGSRAARARTPARTAAPGAHAPASG